MSQFATLESTSYKAGFRIFFSGLKIQYVSYTYKLIKTSITTMKTV